MTRFARPGSDLTGQRFGFWTVVAPARPSGGRRYWWCECQCGTTKAIQEDSLIYGTTRSCGCRSRAEATMPAELPPSPKQQRDTWRRSWRTRQLQAIQDRVTKHEEGA